MDLTFEHGILYTNRGSVPVPEIARSLLATEHTAHRLPAVLEALFPGLHVGSLQVGLRRVSHESPLLEEYLLNCAVEYQEDLEKHLASEASTRNPIERLKASPHVISMLITGLVLAGAQVAVRLLEPEKPTIHIEGNYNNVTVAAGDVIGVHPDEVRKAISGAVGSTSREQRAIANDAVDVLAPAKRERVAVVGTIRGQQQLGPPLVTPEAIGEVPDRALFDTIQPDEWSETFESVRIQIRATDKDHGQSGWAAIIPSVSDRRIILRIVPGIDLNRLAREDEVSGDVIIYFRRAPDGTGRPRSAHLFRMDDRTSKSGS